jgi:hypothetical protein
MPRIILICSILLIASICCCGSTINEQADNHNKETPQLITEEETEPTVTLTKTEENTPTVAITKTEEIIPTITLTKTQENITPTVTETIPTDEENQEDIPSHIPGINPVDILDQFEKNYDLDCYGWEFFWDVWMDECISTGFKDPSYGFTVFSRNEGTVDYIEAGVIQLDYPNKDVIIAYFEEVLELPYEGSSKEEILNWIKSEIITLNGTPGDIREFVYSDITYKLYGNISAIWLEIGEIEKYLE